jgi:hypothetical protein
VVAEAPPEQADGTPDRVFSVSAAQGASDRRIRALAPRSRDRARQDAARDARQVVAFAIFSAARRDAWASVDPERIPIRLDLRQPLARSGSLIVLVDDDRCMRGCRARRGRERCFQKFGYKP